jgi:hypothetical protein
VTDVQQRAVEATTETGDTILNHIVFPATVLPEAIIMGTPVTALCGHVFVPSRDPRRHPPCLQCEAILHESGWEVVPYV